MKKSSKALLALLLVFTILISILGAVSAFIMFETNFVDFYDDFSYFKDDIAKNNRSDVAIYTLFSFTNVLIVGALTLIFAFVAIGCSFGVAYIFVADSDARIKELETIVDEAHMNIQTDEINFYEETGPDDDSLEI